MNATFQFKDQLQAGWDSAKQYLSQGIDLLGASISAGFYKEHNQDDTHSTIHATGNVYERKRTAAMGEWIVSPYVSAGPFTVEGAAGTWVPTPPTSWNSQPFAYTLVGEMCIFQINMLNGALTMTGAENRIYVNNFATGLVPNAGSQTGLSFVAPCVILNNGTYYQGLLILDIGINQLRILKIGGNFVTCTDLAIFGQIAFRIK